jgi:hypothetical protein
MKKFQFLIVLTIGLLMLGTFLGYVLDLQELAGETEIKQQNTSLEHARGFRQYELTRDNAPNPQQTLRRENPSDWFDRRLPPLPENPVDAVPGWYNDSANRRMILVIREGMDAPANVPDCPTPRTANAPWPNACKLVVR